MINGVVTLYDFVVIILVAIIATATFCITRLIGIGDRYYVKDDNQ